MVRIAGRKTVTQWFELRARLVNDFSHEDWIEALNFFDERINERYLNPISCIEDSKIGRGLKGAGFAVCTLICALIETLETFHSGKSFKKTPDPENLYEYGHRKSKEHFTNFIKTKSPLSLHFEDDNDLADDFYSGVRCSLLHDASTCDGWVINTREKQTIVIRGEEKILNRRLFIKDIKQYIQEYKTSLMEPDNQNLRDAFVRKFDGICVASQIVRQESAAGLQGEPPLPHYTPSPA
ncbi:hypothetical protein XE98_000999 [Salmonella enterica subsp. enterica]|nr:hypothetical protein [Salmonella enterica subsp. enterica]